MDGHLGCIFEQKDVADRSNSFVLKMNDVDLAVRNIEYNDFPIIHLAEAVNNFVVCVFKKYCS